jgi:hypothetical protein
MADPAATTAITPPVRWQYRVVNVRTFFTADRMALALGYFGQDGWEFVSVFDKASNWLGGTEKGFMLFKRPVRAGAEPEGPWCEVWSPDSLSTALDELGSDEESSGPALYAAPSDNDNRRGWYPDPHAESGLRWWDGEGWTLDTRA